MYELILLPLDGSNLAEQAIPHAAAQAEHFQARLILLRVLEFMPKDRSLSDALVKETYQLTSRMAHSYLEDVADRVRKQGIKVETATIEGRPHAEIIKFAEMNRVDLIVMCTRGQSGISRWLMGSVADRVVRGAGVPVLLVHTRVEP